MKKVILQLWEETEKNSGIQPDGCSLHIDEKSLSDYTDGVYSIRDTNKVPDIFERLIGRPIEVEVIDNIFNVVEKMKSVRLQQYEMNNLINLKEIKIDDSI
jgi:hypothetical protein